MPRKNAARRVAQTVSEGEPVFVHGCTMVLTEEAAARVNELLSNGKSPEPGEVAQMGIGGAIGSVDLLMIMNAIRPNG